MHPGIKLFLYFLLCTFIYVASYAIISSFSSPLKVLSNVNNISEILSVENFQIIIFPIAATAVTLTAFAVEVFFVGYRNSSIRELLYSKSNSIKIDLLFFFSRISGLSLFFAWLISLGNVKPPFEGLKQFFIYSHYSVSMIHSIALQVLILVIIDSLAFYLFHRMMHTKFFWEIHKFHHSAESYNPLLPYRNHFLDLLFASWFFGFFGLIIGASPTAILISASINALYQSLVHSKINCSNRILEFILITPNAHRIHHSVLSKHANKNFGTLSIWDRLFHTYEPPTQTDVSKFGIDGDNYINPNQVGIMKFLSINLRGVYLWLFSIIKAPYQ